MSLPKINIIVPCGILDIKDRIEVDRYARFLKMLTHIQSLGKTPSNINWVFAEFGEKNRVHTAIRKYTDGNYIFCERHNNEPFNQVKLWEDAIRAFPADFHIFTHSDILFSKDLYEVLNKRIKEKNKNYYAFRFAVATPENILDIFNEPQVLTTLQCEDVGMKYVLEKMNKQYINKFPARVFHSEVGKKFPINQTPNQIPQSLICLSDETLKKFDFEKLKLLSYNNDTIIRDLSILYGIEHEWVNDDLIVLHMHGLDDMIKSNGKEYETVLNVVKTYPELSHAGVFRFHKDNIPYLDKDETKKIYENYLSGGRGVVWNEQDLRNYIYEEPLITLNNLQTMTTDKNRKMQNSIQFYK